MGSLIHTIRYGTVYAPVFQNLIWGDLSHPDRRIAKAKGEARLKQMDKLAHAELIAKYGPDVFRPLPPVEDTPSLYADIPEKEFEEICTR